MLTDGRGVPIGLAVDGAQRHDSKLFSATIRSVPVRRPRPKPYRPQGMCLDKGYDYPFIRRLARFFGFTLHLRTRGEERRDLHNDLRRRARRWVVERTHSWVNRFRGLLIRWSKSIDSYVALLHLAFGIITWRATHLSG
jgi:putative transposase